MRLTEVARAGPATFRWPEGEERFESGWEGTVVSDGKRSRFAHRIGEREVYSARRVHTVTFLDGHAIVEGVAADDYERSGKLLSLIKPGRGHALTRELAEVPAAYGDFEVVSHRDEIDAPYSKRCLALKIAVDDLERWVLHALVRRRSRAGVKQN